jgi:hypothetical protein
MIAIKIPAGDLKLESGTTKVVDGPEYAEQRIAVTCDFFLGEFFLNVREGIPYFRDILIKNPNPDTVRSVFRRAIMQTPGIVAVNSLTWTVDAEQRKGFVDFEAIYKNGQKIARKLVLEL